MKLIRFGQEDIENALANLPPEGVDELPFGAIQLDKEGTVLVYNSAESALTGRDAKDVIGRNFFTEVAPCTNTPEFAGVFFQGASRRHLNTMIEYVFDYRMSPVRVRVHMKRAASTGLFWVFVKRLSGAPVSERKGAVSLKSPSHAMPINRASHG
ncbi:MAG: photoactive yellow protein [Pseudomonadota bacterium]